MSLIQWLISEDPPLVCNFNISRLSHKLKDGTRPTTGKNYLEDLNIARVIFIFEQF